MAIHDSFPTCLLRQHILILAIALHYCVCSCEISGWYGYLVLWGTRAFLLMSPGEESQVTSSLGHKLCVCPPQVYLELTLSSYTVLHVSSHAPRLPGKKGLFHLTLKILVLKLRPPCPQLPSILLFFSKISKVQTTGNPSHTLDCVLLIRCPLRESSFNRAHFCFQPTLTKTNKYGRVSVIIQGKANMQ